MSDDGELEDKKTVVLDIKALQEELKKQESALDQQAANLEFNETADNEPKNSNTSSDAPGLELDELEIVEEENAGNKELILFDFHTDIFKKSSAHFITDNDKLILNTLPELNAKLREDGRKVVVFYYDKYPKAVTKLLKQMKDVFPNSRSIVFTKDKNYSGQADGIINIPVKKALMTKVISDLFS